MDEIESVISIQQAVSLYATPPCTKKQSTIGFAATMEGRSKLNLKLPIQAQRRMKSTIDFDIEVALREGLEPQGDKVALPACMVTVHKSDRQEHARKRATLPAHRHE